METTVPLESAILLLAVNEIYELIPVSLYADITSQKHDVNGYFNLSCARATQGRLGNWSADYWRGYAAPVTLAPNNDQ